MDPKYYAFDPEILDLPKGSYAIGVEKMLDVKEELEPLYALHWDEVEKGFTNLTMGVAWDQYAAHEKNGHFLLFTVRELEARSVVGYFMCYVHRSNQAKNDYVAREDALFVRKDHRGSHLANNLRKYVETTLKKLHCKTLFLSSRHHCGGADLSKWLMRGGYRPTAVVFAKEL